LFESSRIIGKANVLVLLLLLLSPEEHQACGCQTETAPQYQPLYESGVRVVVVVFFLVSIIMTN
jgi:hypothetical protein